MKKSRESNIDILLTCPGDGLRLFHSMIPIGLVSIGTVLQKAGYRVAVIDFNHYDNDYQRQLQFLNPKIIGIGGTTPSRKSSFRTARISKQVLPDSVVVYGGINATFTAQDVLRDIPEIDFIIKGEAELSFLALCNSILRGSGLPDFSIPGLCYRKDAEIVENKPQRINDLSVLPIPNRDLLGDFYNLEMEFIGGPGDFVMTSRGCPTACNFCAASRMFPGGLRLRPIDSVMSEIEYLLSRKKLSGIKIFDSTFTADRGHVEEFCSRMKSVKIPWECEIRADTVDYDLLKLMKESGCYYINMGMETANQSHLRHIAKGITSEQVLDVLSICKKLDIRSKVFFTFGHLNQTFKECLDDIGFIEKNRDRIDFFAVTVGMRIYPSTRLEKECRERGIIKKSFFWTKTARKPGNFLIFEPGDIPVLFQKQLGPVRLMLILLILFSKRLICTERFLLKMTLENLTGILRALRLGLRHAGYCIERMMGRGLGDRVWEGTCYDTDVVNLAESNN